MDGSKTIPVTYVLNEAVRQEYLRLLRGSDEDAWLALNDPEPGGSVTVEDLQRVSFPACLCGGILSGESCSVCRPEEF